MTSAASPATRSAAATSRKAPNITLWVLQVPLACFFVIVGCSHALMPFDQIAQQAAWMNDVPRWLSLFIGYAEIAGGLGLIIPAATRIAPWLTPLAALGLATIMILAIPFHVLKGEASVIWMHALIAALAAVVAGGDGVGLRSLDGRYCVRMVCAFMSGRWRST
jgi:uncharacterized membrane protein YphA (DoxX/SURF4 family)